MVAILPLMRVNIVALFSLIELAPQEAGPFVCDLRCLAYTDSLRNRDEWRSLPRMVAPAIFRKRVL